MQAIILAAGRGKRMGKITTNIPKPLLRIANKTLIEYKIEALPKKIKEIIIVVGYLQDEIKNTLGNKIGEKKIKYVIQKELTGTGTALFCAKDLIKNRFIVLMGDDIYSKKDLEKCCKYDFSILSYEMTKEGKGAKVEIDKMSNLKSIKENKILKKGDYQNTGVYTLNKKIFNYPLVKIPNGEFGLPQTIVSASKDFNLKIVKATFWHRVTTTADLKKISI